MNKSDENGEWRRLPNEEPLSLYRSPNILRMIKYRNLRLAGQMVRMEQASSALKLLTGRPKPTGKRPLGRHGGRWELKK